MIDSQRFTNVILSALDELPYYSPTFKDDDPVLFEAVTNIYIETFNLMERNGTLQTLLDGMSPEEREVITKWREKH